MPTDDTTEGEDLFWELAAPLLEQPGISRSTMMGYPCLRVNGEYFASTHHSTGHLIVKLPAARVDALVEAGRAEPFAPAGRRFKEWAAVPDIDPNAWAALLDDALAFVAAAPPKNKKKRTTKSPAR